MKKYFGNISEKQLYIKEMIDNGEITEEKAWVELERISDFKKSLKNLLSDEKICI